MAESIVEKKAASKTDQWRERIAEQERSGLSARQFCREQGIPEHCFYGWRKRLREQGLVRFALVERGPARLEPEVEVGLELVLTTGERLRIGAGVDATRLRTVLAALRA
jgi:transposase-like protein